MFVVVDPASDDARGALDQYFGELDARFGAGFDPKKGGADSDRDEMRPPKGIFILIKSDGAVVGCGAVHVLDEVTAEVKRMWIHEDWRGQGLGHRLLARLEDEARALGRNRVVLDTNSSLKEAIGLYQRAGYRAIDRYNDNPYAHHFFEKSLE